MQKKQSTTELYKERVNRVVDYVYTLNKIKRKLNESND